MSRTTKTSKARIARKLKRKVIDEFNSGDRNKSRLLGIEMKGLKIDGVRYGNQRKFRAAEKVCDRRVERRKATRAAKNDTDIS